MVAWILPAPELGIHPALRSRPSLEGEIACRVWSEPTRGLLRWLAATIHTGEFLIAEHQPELRVWLASQWRLNQRRMKMIPKILVATLLTLGLTSGAFTQSDTGSASGGGTNGAGQTGGATGSGHSTGQNSPATDGTTTNGSEH